MFSTGKTIRYFRKKKGDSAKFIYHDLLSKSAYVRYEKAETDTKATIFMAAVHRLVIEYKEVHDHLDKQYYEAMGVDIDRIVTKLSVAIAYKDQTMLIGISNELDDLYQQTRHSLFANLKVLTSANLEAIGNAQAGQGNLQRQLEHWRNQEEWFYSDVSLLHRLFPLLTIEEKYEFLILLKEKPPHFKALAYTSAKDNISELYLQGVIQSVEIGDYDWLEKMMTLFREQPPQEGEVFQYITFNLFEDYLADNKKNKKLVDLQSKWQETIAFFRRYGMSEFSDRLASIYDLLSQ